MKSLAVRSREEEQMDAAELGPAEYRAVLSDLVRVNRWTLAARPTLNFVSKAARGSRRLRILDVGFGGGDMLRNIERWAQRNGVSAELIGIDINPKSAAVARSLTPAGAPIEYRTGDYREVEGPFDIILSNLVAHHMSDAELRDFLRFMEKQARKGWMINDLHRHRLAHFGYRPLAALLRVHAIVRADGRLSIARSFRPADWRGILGAAGIEDARIVRRFPFRLCVERLR